MSKRYVLLKDLPNVDAGAIFEKSNIGSTYFYGIPISVDIPHTDQVGIVEFEEKTVKKRTDWFKEITDTPPNPTKNVIVGGIEYLSPRDVWEREKKAFEAGKEKEGIDLFGTKSHFVHTDKYPTFEDYKKANP